MGRHGLLLVPLALLLLAGGASALPYTGPGQTGVVPVGEDGLLIDALAGTADDQLFVALHDVPATACRIVLDGNGTYADGSLRWAPGDPTAYVYGPAGSTDVPFRVHAVWRLDINDACTVEETETATYWHDPLGRPYHDLSIIDRPGDVTTHVNSTVPLDVTVHNNGTISANVSAKILHAPQHRARSTTPVLDVPIAPGENATFTFELTIPKGATATRSFPQITVLTRDGWERVAGLTLDLTPDPDPAKDDRPKARPTGTQEPPTIQHEAPGAANVALIALVAFLAAFSRRADAHRRRRRG